MAVNFTTIKFGELRQNSCFGAKLPAQNSCFGAKLALENSCFGAKSIIFAGVNNWELMVC